MTMEYTDDAISGRSVIAKFRHLKDWVVEKINIINDKVDAMDVSTAVADAEITYDSTPENKTDMKIDLLDKDGETIGTKTVVYSAKTCEIVTENADKIPASVNAVRDYVNAHAGGGVEQTMLGKRAYSEGFYSQDRDYINPANLTKTPLHFHNSASPDKFYGVPVCSIGNDEIVLGVPSVITMSSDYANNYRASNHNSAPRYNTHPGSYFSSEAVTVWGLDASKTYLVLEFQVDPTLSPALSDLLSGSNYAYVFALKSDGITTPRIVKETSATHEEQISISSQFSNASGGFWLGLTNYKGIPVTVYSTVADDNQTAYPCYVSITDEEGAYTVGYVMPLGGSFTDGNSYNVNIVVTSIY